MKYIEICLNSGAIIHADVEPEIAETILSLSPGQYYTFKTAEGFIRLYPYTICGVCISNSDIPDKGVLCHG